MIHEYRYKPDPIFHDVGIKSNVALNNHLYMGVELEVDYKYPDLPDFDCHKELTDMDPHENWYYMKHDGSLSSYGFEIVTHPCTLDCHLKEYPWGDICQTALGHRYKSHNTSTCGLHVHINREAFGDTREEQDLNIAKAILIFTGLWNEVFMFSRREDYQLRWAEKSSQKFYSDDENEELIKKSKSEPNGYRATRYHAINLCNSQTVEFRIFRGTLKVDTIKATLQFLDNLVKFVCETPLPSVFNMDWYDLIHRNEYPELMSYIQSLNLDIHKTMKYPNMPLVPYLIVRTEIPLYLNNELNPFAYSIEWRKQSEMKHLCCNGDLKPRRGEYVAIFAPRSKKKILKIGRVTRVTPKGSVYLEDDPNLYRSSRVMRLIFLNEVNREHDYSLGPYVKKIDGHWYIGGPVADLTGIQKVMFWTNPNMSPVIEPNYGPVDFTSLEFKFFRVKGCDGTYKIRYLHCYGRYDRNTFMTLIRVGNDEMSYNNVEYVHVRNIEDEYEIWE